MTHIPFSPDFESKGYKLIYRNGQRPEDYKVWPDGEICTRKDGILYAHENNGLLIYPRYVANEINMRRRQENDFDLFLTPPEMYVGVYQDGRCTCTYPLIDDLQFAISRGARLYRLVPVEEIAVLLVRM